ncbi:uncharacterized protein LOC122048460 [Zingiber officinale]|uniref:uncharacterized protein LOC122048460 n=1 Tax=Zingiber officinale TaxID=94328 RepID=UPI001C4D46DB|nr:uncharacterized protein LOC122048460 [Zingiber officinale]
MESKEMCTKANIGYDCLLFDLDDTLYPLSSGITAECCKNILEYMLEKLEVEESNLLELCTVLYKHYRTIMAGLKAIGYNFNYDDFHSSAHGRLPYETSKPDLVISQLLLSLPVRKVIFTNGDQAHAAKVLKKLYLEDCFDTIICFETLNPPSSSSREDNSANIFDIIGYLLKPDPNVDLSKTSILCKPSIEAIEHALRIANIDPQRTVVDLLVPYQRGGKIGLFDGAGVGKIGFIMELIINNIGKVDIVMDSVMAGVLNRKAAALEAAAAKEMEALVFCAGF